MSSAEITAKARAALLACAEPMNRPAIERALDTPKGQRYLELFTDVLSGTVAAVQAWDGLPKNSLLAAKALAEYGIAMESFAELICDVMLEQETAQGATAH